MWVSRVPVLRVRSVEAHEEDALGFVLPNQTLLTFGVDFLVVTILNKIFVLYPILVTLLEISLLYLLDLRVSDSLKITLYRSFLSIICLDFFMLLEGILLMFDFNHWLFRARLQNYSSSFLFPFPWFWSDFDLLWLDHDSLLNLLIAEIQGIFQITRCLNFCVLGERIHWRCLSIEAQ